MTTTTTASKTPRTNLKLGITWCVRLVLVAFLVLVLAGVAILIVVPRVSNGTALNVLTGSMTPDIPVGSIVIDRPVDPGTLHVGDIATYQVAPGKNTYITHRIIKIDTKTTPTTFIFKGDANRGPDIKPVPSGAIRGKVWFHVPYLGGIRDGLKGALGRSLLLLLVTLGLAGFAIFQAASWARERRKPSAGEPDLLRLRLDVAALDGVDIATLVQVLGGVIEHGNESEEHDRAVRVAFAGDVERLDVIRALLDRFGDVVEDLGTDVRDLDSSEATSVKQPAEHIEQQPASGIVEDGHPYRRAGIRRLQARND